MMRRTGILIGVVLGSLVMLAGLAGSAAALVPDGTHGWFWQMPQPAGGPSGLSDVAFPTAQDVWAVGVGGLVLHSSDAGATWASQPTGSDADLWSLSFVDAQNGWACGAAVLATHDGGATWLDRTPAKDLADALDDISFVDATHGWIATDDGAVLRTTDGGDTWVRLSLPGYDGAVECDFVDTTHGWAVGDGGHIWETRNGGSSWIPQVSRLDPRDWVGQVSFCDRLHGYVLSYERWYGSVVLATSDGGAHWHHVHGVGWGVTGIDVTGPRSAWLISGGYEYEYFTGGLALRNTTDGGRHWRTSTIGGPASPEVIASHGDAVCAVGNGIVISSDGGSTWRGASSGQAYEFSAASLLSATDIWAVTYSGTLVHSVDGVRWAEQAVPGNSADTPLGGVCFLDAQNGWVVGSGDPYGESGDILHTNDGGATWTPQASNLAGWLDGVDFVDPSTGWAISDDPMPWGLGANTCIERTTDGGATWIPLYVASGAALQAVQFLDASTGWVAGSYQPVENESVAAIFATTNGGFTWTREKLPKDAPEISSMQFLDAQTGWAVGVSVDWDTGAETGWVLRTGDGGKTWTHVEGLDDAVPYAVRFSDAQHGWIGGDNGVWATSDGGTTWQKVAGGYGVTAIAAADPQHVWAFGAGFLVSTVDASGDTAAPATVDQHVEYWSWSSKPVTVHLLASDVGSSGVASTDYNIDGGTWQPGTDVTVAAPADHANDGYHTILYRSTDNAGNREASQTRTVGIDTLGPACSVPRKKTVNAGKQGILFFKAQDATSGVAQATITLLDRRGRVAKRFVERAGNWGMSPPPTYYWLRFGCRLKPGTYRIEVRAVDYAGNAQVTVGRSWLHVVRKGAPRQRHPDWPEGLPDDSSGFGVREGHDLLAAHHGLPSGLADWVAWVHRARELRRH